MNAGYENFFYMQLKGMLRPHNLIIAISCSDNSPDIVKAVKYAKEIDANIVGFTDFDGDYLKENCDINFHINAPKGQDGLVEDIHIVLDHIIFSYYIQKGKVER